MPLQPIVIRAPAFGGLNLEGEDVVDNATFAKVAKNIVFDKAGRIASRQGYTNINDTVAGNVEAIFMYDYSGGDLIITASGSDLYEEATDRTGTLTPSGDNWQFQNFADKVVGAQNGETLIVKSAAGNFDTVAGNDGGTVPNGDVVHSAFGRLWCTNTTGTVIYGSALLDETTWPTTTTTTGSVEINALGNELAVRDGYDRVKAINSFQGRLVVFFENSIIIYSNPFDTANLAIEKTISGIGCISRDSVQHVGNDLVFLSYAGVRSLVRSIEEDNFPLRDLSKHVRGDLLEDISGTPALVKSAYYPDEGLYLLLMPEGTCWAFDFKRVFEDGLPRVTTWDVPLWHSIYYHEGTLYIGQEGEYGQYSGYTEDTAVYPMEYKSLNVDFGSPNIKAIKKSTARLEGADAQVVTFTYSWDYGETSSTENVAIPAASTAAVYNAGAGSTYGASFYGDGINRTQVEVNPFGSGEVLAFGLKADVNGAMISVEQMSHFGKLGRIAR